MIGSSAPAFGSNQPKPTGFGTPFGMTTTTASSGFGGFGSSFGTSNTQPVFGSTQPTFGTSTNPPAFGTGTQQPLFGSGAQQSAFGAGTQQPTFGAGTQQSAFGTSTQQSSFGAQQPTFGTGGQQTPFGRTTSFGSGNQPPAFGSSTGTQQPSFGSFGTTSSTAPTFGSSFGVPISSSAPFGFGATTTTSAPLFGSSFGGGAPSGGGLFGSSTSKPSLFSTPATASNTLFSAPSTVSNLFGSNPQPAPLFGGTSTAAPSLFGSVTSAPNLFGSSFGTATTSTPSLFGGTGFNLFGTTTTAAPSLFGATGIAPTSTTFSGFGSSTPGFGQFGAATVPGSNLFGSSFGTKLTPPAPVQPVDPNQQVLASVYAINIFNDERDDILKKWNMLQACWGTGKGFYNVSNPPVEYTSRNPFYRFKAVGYNIIPELDNSEGYVTLIFNKAESELANQKTVLINGIASILGSKPNLTVNIESLKGISEHHTEVRITVSEKSVTGSSKKIPSSELCNFLNQPSPKQQLMNVGVTNITPYVTPTKTALEEYKKNPPPGIDPQMWHAANVDNPNPQKYIPTPINGFSDLKGRMLSQQNETSLHTAFIQKVNNDIINLKKKHLASVAQISQLKQNFLQLQHRILRILVKQESTRKIGLAVSPEEELLKGRLEMLHAHLKVPTQFKGQINELLSRVKMMGSVEKQCHEHYNIDPDVQEDIKQFLKMEQSGITHLVNIINNDLKTLKTMNEGMNQLLNNRSIS